MQTMLLQNWVQGQSPVEGCGQKLKHFDICKNTILSIICLRFYVLLDTNTGLNFLFVVDVLPLGKCPGLSLAPCRYTTATAWHDETIL